MSSASKQHMQVSRRFFPPNLFMTFNRALYMKMYLKTNTLRGFTYFCYFPLFQI